jgi:cyclophilin family peptidyl-prolyl cis-trans isomerase
VEGLANSSASIGGVNAPDGVSIISPISVAGGQTVSQNIGFSGGLDPNFITMLMFTTESNGLGIPSAPGSGQAIANIRANNAPTISSAIADVSVAQNAADTKINLAGHFTDADFTNSQVTFNITRGGQTFAIPVELFDTTAPRTVANFFDYVTAGDYTNSIFHRLESTFVIQGGGLKLNAAGNNLDNVPVHDLKLTTPTEFGPSNTLGTLAMAQGGNPKTADSQFFFNLANNATALDSQSFTVFGKLLDINAFDTLKTTPVTDFSAGNTTTPFEALHPTSGVASVPIINYSGNATTFAADSSAANFLVINSINIDRRDEFLTYSIVSNSNTNLVTASIDTDATEQLRLDYATGQAGSATIVVRATDRFGATVDETFQVVVGNTAPTATVALSPDAPGLEAIMTATATKSDADGNPVTLTYQWEVNGQIVKQTVGTSNTTDTLDLTTISTLVPELTLAPGDFVMVTVVPNDGFIDGASVSDTVNVNSAPTFDPAPFVTPASPTTTQQVTSTNPATDVDGDTVTYSYDWVINGTNHVRTVPNVNLSSDTLDLGLVGGVNVGDELSLTIIASDGKAETTTTLSTTIS